LAGAFECKLFLGELGPCYISCLKTFWSLDDIEVDRIAFGQGFETFTGDSGEMHEDVLALLLLKKTKTLAVVEPLHSTCCHATTPSVLLV